MAITIREATTDDIDGLTALYGEYFEELRPMGMYYTLDMATLPDVLSTRIRSRLVLTAVAEDGTGLRGFVICTLSRLGREYKCEGSRFIGTMNELYVAADVRRRGVAGRLCDYGEAWLRERGAPGVQFQILRGNGASAELWRKRGADPVGTLYYKSFDD